ncbi:MAG: alanine dehydrogenase [Deltaproteobacteria bacterium]|nr:alanine dehydrogenase [Deltaproteobacteria bacterium]
MVIGVPREFEVQEYRVGMTPAGVARLVGDGHEVLVAAGAGIDSGILDDVYVRMGARMCPHVEEVYERADLVVKVKAPTDMELPMLREGATLFSFLHLATRPDLAGALADSGITAVACETVEDERGRLPLLRPMSEISGKMAVQVGANCLVKEKGGKGILLGGVPGVKTGMVVVLGGGTVGANAARVADGMGASVYILDRDIRRLSYLDDIFQGRVNTVFSDAASVEELVSGADLVIGSVLEAGRRAPVLVREDLVRRMKAGSVVVDVSVDQGGCVETTRPTSHGNPTFVKHGIVHYAVPNMPGAVARTSTFALGNVTIGYVARLAGLGLKGAVGQDPGLGSGVNVHQGHITHCGVAESLGLSCRPLGDMI